PYYAQSSAQYPGQAGYRLGYPPSWRPYSIPLGMPTSNPVEYEEFAYSTAWESTSTRDEVRVFVIKNTVVYWTSFYCILVCCKGYYDTKGVFLTDGITTIVCIIVTIFCILTKVDFTSCGGLFGILAIVVLVTGTITAIVLSFTHVPRLHVLYAAIGAVVYTLVDFIENPHTERLIGKPLSLYVDIVQILIFLLHLVGASTEQRQEDDI
uniref:Transmembrane BAX inhibitor motif containing 1b n=1 Tax=Salmo trutta TaxID=8032 RepID=A0A673Y6H8_SALTR